MTYFIIISMCIFKQAPLFNRIQPAAQTKAFFSSIKRLSQTICLKKKKKESGVKHINFKFLLPLGVQRVGFAYVRGVKSRVGDFVLLRNCSELYFALFYKQ